MTLVPIGGWSTISGFSAATTIYISLAEVEVSEGGKWRDGCIPAVSTRRTLQPRTASKLQLWM